jgi:hypothetical protein
MGETTKYNGAPGKEPGPYVTATQADRIAAAALGEKYANWTPRQVEVTLAGEGDEYPFVQAFARHAIAAARDAVIATQFVSDGIPIYASRDATDDVLGKQ